MKHLIPFLLFCQFVYNNSNGQTIHYPETPKKPVIDSIFGKVIVDNYRWLEDMNNQQVKDWFEKQATLTNDILYKIPGRNKSIEEFTKTEQLASSETSLFVMREAGRHFYKKTRLGETFPMLYYRQGKTGKETLLFNPGSDSVSFNFLPSKDGKKVALTLSANHEHEVLAGQVEVIPWYLLAKNRDFGCLGNYSALRCVFLPCWPPFLRCWPPLLGWVIFCNYFEELAGVQK